MTWEKVQTKGDIPAGVAAHSAVALGNTIYIFGGMTPEGASNSMYKFNTGKVWFLKTVHFGTREYPVTKCTKINLPIITISQVVLETGPSFVDAPIISYRIGTMESLLALCHP